MKREIINEEIQKNIDNNNIREKRKKIVIISIKIISTIIILITTLYLYTNYISNRYFIIKEKRIINSKISNNFNGLKIIHFSDLLYGSTIKEKELNKIINLINKTNPDLVLFSGNLIDKNYKLNNNEQQLLINKLSKIKTNLGKYSVIGNKDIDENRTILNESNFITLNNTYELVYNNQDSSILLIGEDTLYNNKQNIEKSFEYFKDNNNSNIYTMVLVNESNSIDNIIPYKPDLIMAGSNLNGYIKLPFINKGIIKKSGTDKFLDEYYKINNTDIFVSNGLGTDDIGVRFNNLPSINLYRLSNY